MKKFFAIVPLLCLLLVGCGAEKTPSADAMADFASVGESYMDAVRHVVAAGVMTADENNCFRPQEVLTRAEAENLLYGAAGLETTSDSTEEHIDGMLYAQTVMKVTGNEGNNVLGGMLRHNTNLSKDPVTREQAAQLLSNYLTYKEALAAGLEHTTVSLSGDNVKLLGRAEVTEDGILTNFPGDGVEFTIECAGTMDVQFDVGYNAYFCAAVDGVQTEDRNLVSTAGTTLAGMIPMGKHTIRIVQDSEINTSGLNNITTGVTMLCKADTLTAAPERDLYIEFIGDSITAGQGNLGDPSSKWNLESHSGTHAYSYMTANKMNADYAIIAKGGIGAYMCSSSLWDVAPYLIDELYGAQNVYRDAKAPATHGKADVIVIGIGTNDREETPDTRFETKFRELVLQVREGNPDADIVFIFNMMNLRHGLYYGKLAEELGGAEEGYYSLMLDRLTNGVPSSKGGTPHPSAEDNEKNSDKLAEFLKTLPSVQGKK